MGTEDQRLRQQEEAWEWGKGLSRREIFWGRFMFISGLIFGGLMGAWLALALPEIL